MSNHLSHPVPGYYMAITSHNVSSLRLGSAVVSGRVFFPVPGAVTGWCGRLSTGVCVCVWVGGECVRFLLCAGWCGVWSQGRVVTGGDGDCPQRGPWESDQLTN